MDRLKLLYFAMVLAVIIFIVFTLFSGIYQAINRPNESATFTTQALAETENFSVFHYDITNREGRETNYKICTDFEGATTCFWQPIENGKIFTYARYFLEDESKKRKLVITVYKEDDPEPIENVTYYV